MNRVDDSKYLLYLEFDKKDKREKPFNDEIVKLMYMALADAKEGTSKYSDPKDKGTFDSGDAYLGVFTAADGARSTNCDYLLINGMITNSLAPYYLLWYRDVIPESEMEKVLQLEIAYGKVQQVASKRNM